MTSASDRQVAIIRTERGLTIAGTRISLYNVVDLLKAHYPPKLIRGDAILFIKDFEDGTR